MKELTIRQFIDYICNNNLKGITPYTIRNSSAKDAMFYKKLTTVWLIDFYKLSPKDFYKELGYKVPFSAHILRKRLSKKEVTYYLQEGKKLGIYKIKLIPSSKTSAFFDKMKGIRKEIEVLKESMQEKKEVENNDFNEKLEKLKRTNRVMLLVLLYWFFLIFILALVLAMI